MKKTKKVKCSREKEGMFKKAKICNPDTGRCKICSS